MQHLVFAFLAPAATLATLLALFYASRRSDSSGVTPLSVYLGLASLSLVACLFEMAAAGRAEALFWSQLSNLLTAGLPIAWLAFALQYAGLAYWLVPGRFWIFLVIPMLTLVLTITNAQHGLVWSSFQIEREGSFLLVQVAHGSWFWLQWLYSFGTLAAGALLIVRANQAAARDHIFQTAWAAVFFLLPLLASAFYLFELVTGLVMDYSPIAFALSALVFAREVLKPPLFDQMPPDYSDRSDLAPIGNRGLPGPVHHQHVLRKNGAAPEQLHGELSGSAEELISESTRQPADLEALVKTRTRSLTALYEVTAATNLTLELAELLTNVMSAIVNVLHLRVVLLHLDEVNYTFFTAERSALLAQRVIDDLPVTRDVNTSPGRTLFLVSFAGLKPDQAANLSSSADAGAPWQQSLAQDRIVVQPQMPFSIRVGEIPLEACVCVPVHAKGRVQGVLSVLDESFENLAAEDMALLAVIADHVGGAVERARLRRMAEQAAVTEERQRLARDLHDTVTQTLYSLVLFAEAGKDALASGNLERVGNHLVRLRDTAQQALKEMRLLIYELRPLALQHAGLVGALNHRLETVEQRAGIETRLEIEGLIPLPERIEAGLYIIAQEALNNVLKHARATQVVVRLSAGLKGVELEIIDNGQGFLNGENKSNRGIGLASMHERARSLGGTVSIHSDAGRGTRVLVSIQLEELY